MFLTITQYFVYTNVRSSARVVNWPEFALKISNTICTIGNNLDSQRSDLRVIWYDMIRTDLISRYLINTTIHWSGCINNQVGSGICFDDLHRCCLHDMMVTKSKIFDHMCDAQYAKDNARIYFHQIQLPKANKRDSTCDNNQVTTRVPLWRSQSHWPISIYILQIII